MVPDALGDISSPARGRGVAVSDLYDLDARRRFGEFGRKFVKLERLRQARRMQGVNSSLGEESQVRGGSSIRTETESSYERRCVPRQYVRMCNVTPSMWVY
jgi:hypothetical protein